MTRKHRSVHRLLWPALALTLALGFSMALYLRLPIAAVAPQATTSQR